ncbi:MAG: FKBP-type peptidyl-prolyl cis-trans isomerase N-terminal domain-containing protein, partial [Pirellula staleyi]
MLLRASVALFVVLGCGLSLCHSQEQVGGAALAPIVPANAAFKDTSSYALGFNVGSSFAQRSMTEKEIDGKDFMQGLLDALSKKECKLDQKQLEAAFQALDQRMQKKMLELAKENMDRAKVHLETNKKKDGVQTTKTGLQYEVLKTGNGKTPTLTDTVVVHYEGKLLNGIVF